MNTGLYRIEWTWLPGSRFAGPGDRLSTWPAAAIGYPKTGLIWSTAALAAIGGAWMLLSGEFGAGAEGEPAMRAVVAEQESLVTSTLAGVREVATVPEAASAPEVAEPNPPEASVGAAADRLKISSQRWRRGGLGSKALVTFTLRNRNDYAVKDIEISCAFSRGDGSHVTDRTRVIHDTVKTKGRKTFASVHVGFVNINANRAKCTPVAASRV
jgi:hypothetical protein